MTDQPQAREPQEPESLSVDVVVLGDSPTALQSALDFAEVGLSVLMVRDDTTTTWPAIGVADPTGTVATFIDRVATPVSDDVAADAALTARMTPQPRNFVAGHDSTVREISRPETLGIPGVPLHTDVSFLLGSGTALRAYLDRLAPVLSVGKQPSIWRLTSKRMGKRTAHTLLRPLLITRLGVPLEGVETALVAPGLNEALTRAGALSGAVLALTERWAEREITVDTAAGWHAVRTAAIDKLQLFNSAVIHAEVIDVSYIEHGDDHAEAHQWKTTLDDGRTVTSRAVVADRHTGDDHRAQVPGEPDRPRTRTSWSSTVTPSERDASSHTSPFWQAQYEQPSDDDFALGPDRQLAVLHVPDTSVDGVSLVISRTLTAEGTQDDHAHAELFLPVGDGGELTAAERDAVLAQAGATRTPGSRWVTHEPAAAFSKSVDRDRAEHALREATEQGRTLSVTGALWHGNDLGAALAHAHERAVYLRRELTGIAEH